MVYGLSLDGSRAIPAFVRAVLQNQPPIVAGAGSAKRDYLYIDDAIYAILLTVARRPDGVFNIGSGVGTSTLQLANAVIKVSGKDLSPRQDAAGGSLASGASLVYDIEKARRVLDFQVRHDLETGLKKLMATASNRRT